MTSLVYLRLILITAGMQSVLYRAYTFENMKKDLSQIQQHKNAEHGDREDGAFRQHASIGLGAASN